MKPNILRRGRSMIPVSGTLSGSGTLSIPAGVASITITAKGGTGGNNYWYDPGQSYIASVAGQPYIAPSYGWTLAGTYPYTSPSDQAGGSGSVTATAGATNAVTFCNETSPGSGVWSCTQYVYNAVQTSAGQPYIASVAGRPYIAPSSGGGDYYGPSTTATVLGITRTWSGGLGSTSGTQSVQTLSPNGSPVSMTYSVGSGGSMSYTYEY